MDGDFALKDRSQVRSHGGKRRARNGMDDG